MPFLIPPNRKQAEKTMYQAASISKEKQKARAAWIAWRWTSEQRSERKRLSVSKINWLFRLIVRSSNHLE